MKSNSQISTTKDQSERLLALGLKKQTADCIWCEVRTLSKDNPIQWRLLPKYIDKHDEKHIPAWSLHRLIEMLDSINETVHCRFGGVKANLVSTNSVYEKIGGELIDLLFDMCVKLKEEGVI